MTPQDIDLVNSEDVCDMVDDVDAIYAFDAAAAIRLVALMERCEAAGVYFWSDTTGWKWTTDYDCANNCDTLAACVVDAAKAVLK